MKKAKKVIANNDVSLRPREEIPYPGQHLEGKYGFCNFTPSWLQFCNNPAGFLTVTSVFLLAQGAVTNGIFNVIITTLERRFGFKSSETGFIAVCYDIGYFAACLFVTFYANRGHRLRTLAIGSILYGIGILLFAIPHFTTGLYRYGEAESPFCVANRTLVCEEKGSLEDLHSYYIFIFAMCLQGIGCVPLYTVTYAVFEDSLPKTKSPIYISILNAMAIFGPVIGYVTGGYLLSIYVDFNDPVSTGNTDLDIYDPRWVGAWWLGHFVTSGFCFVFIAIPIFGFPRQFPGSAKTRSFRKSEVHAHAGDGIARQEDFGKSIKDMPAAILLLFKNPTYLFTVLAACTNGIVVSGYSIFLPKIMQNQYNTTPSKAGLLSGAISLPGGAIGCFASGIIISKLNLKTRGLLKFSMGCMILLTLTAPIVMHYCPNSLVAGVTTPYGESDLEMLRRNLTSLCNTGCNCRQEYFNPVCADSVTYFSACHAGCNGFNSTSLKFTNCKCVANGTETAEAGMCENTCDAIIPFIIVFFVALVIFLALTTPTQLVAMRCVPGSLKPLAMGLLLFLIRALGHIPGPLVFGAVLDSACILWQEKDCEEGKGSCYMYNSKRVAISVTIIGVTGYVLSCIMFYLAMRFYKPARNEKASTLDKGKDCDSKSDEDYHLQDRHSHPVAKEIRCSSA